MNQMTLRRKRDPPSIQEFIPAYLRRWVQAHHGDFCVCQVFHPNLMAQLMSEGFLPIATQDILLPKLHEERCVISLPDNLHIGKSTKKRARKFKMTINQAFHLVVRGCQEQHGSKCWLYPRLVEVFETMHSAEHTPAFIMGTNASSCPVRIYSIEVWNVETRALAGGELGYSVGNVYTSLTGFCRENSAGSVQLAALGQLLIQQGFSLWDLGMEMDYKRSLGCHLMSRQAFVAHIQAVRHAKGHLRLPVEENRNCKDIIIGSVPVVLPATASSSSGMQSESRKMSIYQSKEASPDSLSHTEPKRPRVVSAKNQADEEKKSDDIRIGA